MVAGSTDVSQREHASIDSDMRPADHADRMARARLALEGLSVGDAFGERFFRVDPAPLIATRTPPAPPWKWTDDTAMALSIIDILDAHGAIDQDALAALFAERYMADPDRGYGAGAHCYLEEMAKGSPWQVESRGAFDGRGSFGNGAAMRVAPLGAYFADDLPRLVVEAARSAEVTHAHPEGQAGAIAAAVMTALAWTRRADWPLTGAAGYLQAIIARTPEGETRVRLERATALPADATAADAAVALGNGSRVAAHDTVPFCAWAIARFGHAYEEALWQTVSALGDRDTTCAIVGGAVALIGGLERVPRAWRDARERLP
jgi:ADP-ribosylglycohydrolase